MIGILRSVRAGERRDAAAAFLVLFGVVASHTLLETARDALFLGRVPAERLPWVYLAIAAASLLFTEVQQRIAGRMGGRAALSLWIGVAAAITLSFWFTIAHVGAGGLYALYIWSGILTSLVLIHFWTLLGDLF